MNFRNLLVATILFMLAIGLIFGPYIDDIPGFVVIVIDNTTYELRLWFAVALLFTFFIFFIVLANLVSSLLRNSRRVVRWTKSLTANNARQKTINGMIAFAEGNWALAEKLNKAAAKHSDTKLLNYLVAAQAAQQQHQNKKRDDYLALAQKSQPNAKTAVYLTQAKLQLQEGQLEQALATLSQLQSDNNSSHKHVLQMLATLYEQLQDWEQLQFLLPKLRKQKVLSDEALEDLECSTTLGLLEQAARKNDWQAINAVWESARSSMQRKPELIEHYVKLLVIMRHGNEAEQILRDAIKRQWNDRLVFLYGQTSGDNSARQLATAEQWLKHQKNNPYLLMTLGKLSLEAELWGKATSYLEEAIKVRPLPEAYVYLGQAKEFLNEQEQAFACYKKGLALAVEQNHSSQLTMGQQKPLKQSSSSSSLPLVTSEA